MGTSAGFEFEATSENAEKLRSIIDELDGKTNIGGLDVACTPTLSKNRDGTYYFSAQTHWSYDGENGRAFLKEAKKLMKANDIEINILEEWEA